MASRPPFRKPVIVRPAAPRRTAVIRRQRRPAQGGGGLILAFVIAAAVFGILLAALATNNNVPQRDSTSQGDSAPLQAAERTQEGTEYDRILAEIVSRTKTSQTEEVLSANRATFHQQINDSPYLTATQKAALRGEIIRAFEARKSAMARASFQR